jgi:CRP/FNR family transcriptional regulator
MKSAAAAHSSAPTQDPAQEARDTASGSVSRLPTRCSSCSLRKMCLPCGLTGQDAERVDELIYTRRRIRRGATLYHAGDTFVSLYAVRSGVFKTNLTLDDGRDQVTGFHMAGEIMGMEGIGSGQHTGDAIALEDSEVCVIPYARLENLGRDLYGLQRQFHKLMSQEIVRENGVMLLLGSMRAEERLAAFLLNLSQRFTARGYSPSEFNVRMTREEIGSYLGLKLETVSRVFSRFQDEGLIVVQQKYIQIKDPAALQRVVGRCTPA